MYKLWIGQFSPFARKARIVVLEKNLSDEVEEIVVNTTPLENDKALKSHNPLGKIPCLTLENGGLIADSRVICRFLDDIGQGASLHPSGNVQHETLIALTDGMMECAVSMVYEMRVRPEEMQFQSWIDAQWGKVSDSLVYVEKNYLDMLGIANMGAIGLFCALEYLDIRHGERNWREIAPKLANWLEGVQDRESFVATRPG